MSQESILEKSLQIRNETQEYANTRGRVADVLDDINETKANRTEVTDEIDEAVEALNIGSKMDRPAWGGSVKYYLVKSDAGSNNLQEMTLSANRVPMWSGSNLVDSPVYVSSGRVGIGAASVSEVLEVAGNVKANAVILPANGSSAIANRLRSDGTSLYYANGSSVERRIAYFDDINSANVTSAINVATTAQKTTMRTALLGTATPANPTLQDVAPRFVTRGLIYIDLLGLNLLLLAPVFIWIEKLDGTKIYATNFYNTSNTVVTTQWDLPADLPLGDYAIQIQNGVTTQGLSTAKFTVVNSMTELFFLNSNWKRKLRLLSNGNEATTSINNTSSDNYIRIDNTAVNGFDGTPDSIPAVIYKSENVFPGNKDFDIEITVNLLSSSGSTGIDFTPYIGLTETSHANFSNILAITYNTNVFESIRSARMSLNSPNFDMTAITFKIYVSKVGNKVNWRFSNNNQSGFMYKQDIVDTTKNYAVFFRASYHNNNLFSRVEHFITSARIVN